MVYPLHQFPSPRWGSEQSPRLGRQGPLAAVALAIVLSSSRVRGAAGLGGVWAEKEGKNNKERQEKKVM